MSPSPQKTAQSVKAAFRRRGDDATEDSEKPFIEHLEDLRSTIIQCMVFLGLGVIVAIPLTPWILDVLSLPVAWIGRDPAVFLKIIRVAGGFVLATRVAVWSGVLFSAPFLVWAIAGFVFPGLTRREKRVIRRTGALATGLFVAGVVFCYFTTLPVTLQMMLGLNSWMGKPTDFVEFSDYIGFALNLLLGFGLAFELPVVLMALGSVGVVTAAGLRRTWRYAVVIILIVAAVLTPPDVFSQVLMAGPLLLLYEMGVWLVRMQERAAARREDPSLRSG